MKNLIKFLFLGLIAVSICGCGDSGSKKWRMDNKNLTKNELELLKENIAFRNEIDQKKQWEDLDGDDWAQLLIFFPEEAKRCRELKGFEKFDSSDWALLLPHEPKFEKECKKNRGFELFTLENWKDVLSKNISFSKKISKSYRDLIPWEKFRFSDWCEILEIRSDLIDTFKHNVNVPKMNVFEIRKAISEANEKGFSTLDKFDFWSQFTPQQYAELIYELNLPLDINTLSKLENLARKLEAALEKAALYQDPYEIDELSNSLGKESQKSKNYDKKFIISKAKKNGIFQKFTQEQWEKLFTKESSKSEDFTLLLNEFISLKTQHPDVIQKLLEKFIKEKNIELISKYNLWNNLSEGQWDKLLNNVPEKDLKLLAEGYFSLGKLYPDVTVEFVKTFSENEDRQIILAKYKWWNTLSEEQWYKLLDNVTFEFYTEGYFSSEKLYPKITNIIINNFIRWKDFKSISKYNLWNNLSEGQWDKLLNNVPEKDLKLLAEKYFSLEKLYPDVTLKFVETCSRYEGCEIILSKYEWWNKLSEEQWDKLLYPFFDLYMLNNKGVKILEFYINGYFSLEKLYPDLTKKFIKIINKCGDKSNSIFEYIINKLDFKDACDIMEKVPKLFDSLEDKSEISLDNLFILNKAKNIILWEKALDVNTVLPSKKDKDTLSLIFSFLRFQSRKKIPSVNIIKNSVLISKILSSNIKLFCKRCQRNYDEMVKHDLGAECLHNGEHDWTFSIYNPDTDLFFKKREEFIFICSNCFEVNRNFEHEDHPFLFGCEKNYNGEHKWNILAKFRPRFGSNIFTCKRCKLSIETDRKPKSNNCKSGKPHEWELDPNQK